MRSKIFAVLLVSVCALFFAATASAADSIYWVNFAGSALGRADLSGGAATGLGTTEHGLPVAAAIDSAAGKFYWLELPSRRIAYANFDGSEQGTLDIGGAPLELPTAAAIDPDTGRIYWTNLGPLGPVLAYANLDGSGGGVIPTTGADLSSPLGVAIDPSLGRIYWANTLDSTIAYANLDGSGGGTLPIAGPAAPQSPSGVAIDGAQGRIYWSDDGTGAIGYANLDGSGSGHLDVGGAPIEEPFGLAIDPSTESIYWADQGTESISVASLAGTGGSELDITSTIAPKFPMLLVAPRAGSAAPVTPSVSVTGSTLTCPGVAWQPDLVESQLYDAPERTAISWTFEGAPVEGATGATLAAAQAGTYACQVTATNAAGSTTVPAGNFQVTVPPGPGSGSNSTPVPDPGPTASGPPSSKHTSARKAQLKVVKVRYDRVDGTATVLLKTSGPGRVTMSGKGVAGGSAKASGAGMATLKVAPWGAALKGLRQSGRAKATVKIKFTAAEGGIASRQLTLHFVTE